jgi:hypothetical protein
MDDLACFLILLSGGLLERERCWGSVSVKQYCFVSDHITSNINITQDNTCICFRGKRVQNVPVILQFPYSLA